MKEVERLKRVEELINKLNKANMVQLGKKCTSPFFESYLTEEAILALEKAKYKVIDPCYSSLEIDGVKYAYFLFSVYGKYIMCKYIVGAKDVLDLAPCKMQFVFKQVKKVSETIYQSI